MPAGQPMGEPGQGQAQSDAPMGGEQPPELGTGLVPESPEFTADQIAGQQALQQAQELLAQAAQAQAQAEAQAAQQNAEGQPSQSQQKSKQTAQAQQSTASNSQSESSDNEKAPDAPLELNQPNEGKSESQNGSEDSNALARKYADQPWFAKLPPSLRQAIQARMRNRPPRGYEERLRRYFESLD
jgi:hypothetical protein